MDGFMRSESERCLIFINEGTQSKTIQFEANSQEQAQNSPEQSSSLIAEQVAHS